MGNTGRLVPKHIGYRCRLGKRDQGYPNGHAPMLVQSGRFGLLPVRPPPVRPLTRSAPYLFGPLIYNASPGLSVTESAWSERYPFGPLPWYIQLYYRPTTTTTTLNQI